MYGCLLLLGILLGLAAFLYQKALLSLPKLFAFTKLPAKMYPLIPFLLIVPIGLFFPHFLGGGNQIVTSLAQEHFSLLFLIGLFFLRFIFSMISYGSGLPGGIFLPILTLGAILGVLYGTFTSQFFGLDTEYTKSFLILAMAGYFTGIGKAPLTAIILVTEMVGSFSHLMPLGIVSLITYLVVDFLGGQPIYESLLERLVPHKEGNIAGHKTIIEFPITVESRLDGLMVRDFQWPEEMLLVSIRRGAKEVITKGDTIMRASDTLLILTNEKFAHKIRQQIQQNSQR